MVEVPAQAPVYNIYVILNTFMSNIVYKSYVKSNVNQIKSISRVIEDLHHECT